jgi:FtsP/CotA-like multicopper oxidase with cupredoxin domain
MADLLGDWCRGLGDWMLHCHVADHQVAGMMTVLRVA